MEDSKLQISDKGLEQITTYGSKEDDASAQKCLSDIEIHEDQTKESLATVIVKNLDNILEVKFFSHCYLFKILLKLSFHYKKKMSQCSVRRLQ